MFPEALDQSKPTLPDTSEMVTKSKTVTATFTPIITALIKAEEYLAQLGYSGGQWHPVNAVQQRFFAEYFSNRDELEPFLQSTSDDEPLQIESVASEKAEDINRFLREHGFDIALTPWPPPPPKRFGVGSVMDVLVRWANPGTSTELLAKDQNRYPAVDQEDVMILRKPNSREPIAYLPTKHPDYMVGMTIPVIPIENEFDLLDFVVTEQFDIWNIQGVSRYSAYDYTGIIFPKVDLDHQPDISWLVGVGRQEWFIQQALQQTKFKMNEIGAHARSAVAVEILSIGGGPPPPYKVDRPFVTWIQRKEISLPLFAGYIDYPDWKDPGDLEAN